MNFRFTLSHNNNGTVTEQEINQPDGWKGSKIKLERDMNFMSLIEHYEGGAGGDFIFYGDNQEVNGGIDFLKDIEQNFGFNADIDLTVEFSPDDVNYEELFTGLVNLVGKNEMPDNKMQVPVVRDDFWNKFITRLDTPVDLSSTTDIDGNPVNAVTPVTLNLTCQKVRQVYQADYTEEKFDLDGSNREYIIPAGQYGIISFEHVVLNEIDKTYNYINTHNSEVPFEILDTEYAGTYNFNFNLNISDQQSGILGTAPTGIGMRFQLNDDAPITVTGVNVGTPGVDESSRFSFDQTFTLKAHDLIKIYFINTSVSPVTFYAFNGNTVASGVKNITITADTIFPESTAQGYLIHDAIFGVLQRIGLGNYPLVSEYLGSAFTNTKQYPEDGCGWMYAVVKGLQIRGYDLSEKKFFTSFKHLWEGINPILNLGLGYELADDSPASQVIRIEQKNHFLQNTTSINFSNVREINSGYDRGFIFKSVKVGYKKWQSENLSALDDPQTKKTYALPFYKIGRDGGELNLESEFIAAGIAIETTRREALEKNADYKYDNDTFIIALKENDVSPDRYAPELNENFNDITGLVNSDTRYNLILTPLRNFLRWAPYVGGCMQSYTTSSYKFSSGEGNYSMTSDYACGSGNMCQAVLCDSVAENQDIPLGPPANFNSVFGYYFLPMEYKMTIPLEWDDFVTIRQNPKVGIGISQSDTDHKTFFIKELVYDIVKGQADITAWPREYFDIQVIQGDYNNPGCPIERSLVSSDDAASEEDSDFDADYQAILDYAELNNYQLPSTEQQYLQNQFILDLKDSEVWDDLDLLYVFATDGDRDFAKINWKNPGTNNCSEIDLLTFDENIGFSGDASSSYLNTDWAPDPDSVNYSQNEAGVFCYIHNEIASNVKLAFGVTGNSGGSSSGHTSLIPRNAINSHTYNVNATGTVTGSAVSSIGFFHTRRVASDDQRLFKNGTQVGSVNIQPSTSLSTHDMYILARNNDGTADTFSNHQIGIFGIGASLTGKESALYSAWNDYFTSI